MTYIKLLDKAIFWLDLARKSDATPDEIREYLHKARVATYKATVAFKDEFSDYDFDDETYNRYKQKGG